MLRFDTIRGGTALASLSLDIRAMELDQAVIAAMEALPKLLKFAVCRSHNFAETSRNGYT